MNRRFWTFESLVGAFLDLFIAYFLLCGSTIALFAVKFLGLFDFSTPSIFGNPSSNLRSLLVEYPTDRVSSVQYSVIRKFPFDSIFHRVNNNSTNDGSVNDGNVSLDNWVVNGDKGFRHLEGEASCSSDARKVVRNEVDVEGKGGLNYQMRGGLIRRKTGGGANSGKDSSVSSSTNWITCVMDQGSNNDGKEFSGGYDGSSVASGGHSGHYEGESPMVEKSENTYDIKKRIPVNEADKDTMIVLLTRELEEEHAARAALYGELEKERNAAATAADEAMSMILRLQEEKASIEMESHQYQRMIEEKSAYDEEEMNILKEIVLRREREKHFLEKEVEAYRKITRLENDQFNNELYKDFTESPDLMKDQRLYEDDFSKQEEPEKTIAIVGDDKNLEVKTDDATDSRVYDVHVIDQDPKSSEKPNKTKKKSDQNWSGLESSVGLPPVSSKSSLRRNSTSALDNELTKLDTEVEWLTEKLRIVQEGREKLNFSIDNREKESLQLQLLEDIARQLQEIRMLTEPKAARQASLPLPSTKNSTKKRRCRSVSSGPPKSS